MNEAPRILIVDDEPAVRSILARLLVGEGYELAFADNGTEALEKAAAFRPDLILLDVVMPGMDGFEVCRHLRADPLLAEVAIIVVTALNDGGARLRGIEAGADEFISKPFNGVELQARVRTVTQLNRYRRLLLERAKFEWVVEQTNDGYLLVNDSGQVLYANPQARLYLGLSANEGGPVPKTFVELAGKQYHCQPQEAWASWPEEPAIASPRYLVRPESPRADAFWLQVDTRRLPSGPDAGWIVRLRDITMQIALQRDMGGFHAMMFHKLRTPLTVILASLEILANLGARLSGDDVVEMATRGLKSVQRLQSEIEDILQYLNAPSLAQPGEGFNLSQLRLLVAEISADLGLKSVVVSGHENLGDARLLLSQQGLELVLWEILENAKKFHPKQAPTVEVVVSLLDSHEVSIQIGDDGLTLSPAQLAQVWTPYYQGEKDFTGEVTGMGLGLSAVASVIWGVGGACHLYNREEGPGVVVELVLPKE